MPHSGVLQRRLYSSRSVELIRADDESVYIASGLKPGERVITTAIDIPLPGTRLLIAGDEGGRDDGQIARAVEPEG